MRKQLKNRLVQARQKSPGQIVVALSMSQDELTRINVRCNLLKMNRSAYFRQLAMQDILYNSALGLHVARADFLKETEASLLALQSEKDAMTKTPTGVHRRPSRKLSESVAERIPETAQSA